VRRERKNFRRTAERMIKRTSVSLNENQNSELLKLIDCIDSSNEGQEELNKVFEEAENRKPGSRAVIREMWQMEKEAFFKDQSKNVKLDHVLKIFLLVYSLINFFIHFFVLRRIEIYTYMYIVKSFFRKYLPNYVRLTKCRRYNSDENRDID